MSRLDPLSIVFPHIPSGARQHPPSLPPSLPPSFYNLALSLSLSLPPPFSPNPLSWFPAFSQTNAIYRPRHTGQGRRPAVSPGPRPYRSAAPPASHALQRYVLWVRERASGRPSAVGPLSLTLTNPNPNHGRFISCLSSSPFHGLARYLSVPLAISLYRWLSLSFVTYVSLFVHFSLLLSLSLLSSGHKKQGGQQVWEPFSYLFLLKGEPWLTPPSSCLV